MSGCALYRFYDADGALLYVGISADPEKRIGQHRCTAPWAGEIVQNAVAWFDDREAAEKAERTAIKREEPRHNVHHGNGRRTPTGAFRNAVVAAMGEHDTTITALSQGAEVSRDVINKLIAREGSSTNVENAIRIASFYGFGVEDFIQRYADPRP